MQKFIARANVARFEALIAGEPDEAKRQLLEQMLGRERETLNGLGDAGVAAVAKGDHHAPAPVPQLRRGGLERPAD